jgi:hypothetical protein
MAAGFVGGRALSPPRAVDPLARGGPSIVIRCPLLGVTGQSKADEAVIESPVSQAMPEIQQPWLVSFLPPSPTHRRAALTVSTFLLVAFVITVPFAEVMLPQLNIYIPLVATVMFLNDLITASLLLVLNRALAYAAIAR